MTLLHVWMCDYCEQHEELDYEGSEDYTTLPYGWKWTGDWQSLCAGCYDIWEERERVQFEGRVIEQIAAFRRYREACGSDRRCMAVLHESFYRMPLSAHPNWFQRAYREFVDEMIDRRQRERAIAMGMVDEESVVLHEYIAAES